MEKLKRLLLGMVLTFMVFGCAKDEVVLPETGSTENPPETEALSFRAYDEDSCGSIRDLCTRCIIVAEPGGPIMALADMGEGFGDDPVVDDNAIELRFGEDLYTIRPANFFGPESEEYLITTPQGNFVTSNLVNEYINSHALEANLPQALDGLFELDFERFTKGQLSPQQVQAAFGVEGQFGGTSTADFNLRFAPGATGTGSSSLLVYNPCEGVTLPALVLKYKETLGLGEPHPNAEWIIEDALFACMEPGFDPRYDCVNTQCVVDGILADPEIVASPEAQFTIKLNYLNALLRIDELDYDALSDYTPDNVDIVNSVYDHLGVDLDDPACSLADCGKTASSAAYLVMLLEEYDLSAADRDNLDAFYGYMYCNDRSTFNNFWTVNDFAAIEELLALQDLMDPSCSLEEVAASYAELYCEAFYPDHPFFEADNQTYYDCVLAGVLEEIGDDEVGWGIWIKLAKFAKKVFKAYRRGDDLTKAQTWKDIVLDVFDAALALADGNVTIDEVITAIIDIGLGIDADDLKWMKRLLGFVSDATKLTPNQIDFALDMADAQIQHRFRHFERLGYIPSTGPVSAKIDAFKNLAGQIMSTNPVKTVKDGDTIKFLHEYEGETILVVVYDTGDALNGKLKQMVKATDGQIAKIMDLPDY